MALQHTSKGSLPGKRALNFISAERAGGSGSLDRCGPARLRLTGHDVQHRGARTGTPRPTDLRSAPRQTVPGTALRQGAQRALVPAVAPNSDLALRALCRAAA